MLKAWWLAALFAIVSVASPQDGQIPIEPGALTKDPTLQKIRVEQRLGSQLPLDEPLIDEQGKKVKLGDYFGKRPVLYLPIFYRCTGVCSIELESIVATLRDASDIKIGRDLDVVAVSLNPREDYVLARSKRYSVVDDYGKPETTPNWHFLIGKESDVKKITDALGFYYLDDPAKDWVNHPSGIMVITPKGVVSRYMLGLNYETSVLRQAVGIASQEEIGKASTELFFGCVHIDSVTGKRTIVIENVLKVLAVITIGVVIVTITTLSLTRRKGSIDPALREPDQLGSGDNSVDDRS